VSLWITKLYRLAIRVTREKELKGQT
jgi:hypothetical protein